MLMFKRKQPELPIVRTAVISLGSGADPAGFECRWHRENVAPPDSRRDPGCLVLLVMAGVLVLLSTRMMPAQTVSSSLDGTITDTSGSIVQGAALVLTNLSTGMVMNTTSDGAGRYAFPSISLGRYSLTATKDGFAAYKLSDFKIVAAQHANQDIVLSVGTLTQTVTVSGGGLTNLLQSGSNDMGTLIEEHSVTELPLNGRNFLQLGLLSGATVSAPGQDLNTSMASQYARFNFINIAGIENDLTMYLVNGVQVFGARASNVALELPVGAIDQFRVHYGFFMPDMGSNPGVVDLLTKSGSNRLHGEVFEFLRNNAWDARNFFSPTSPGPFHRNQFGADAGGAIRKDKVFFFGSYEGLRQVLSTFMGDFAPTQAMFQGDFSALATPIYNPFTYDASTGNRQPFTGNVIPPDLINPVSQKLLQYYLPGSNYSLKPINVSGTPRTILNYDQFTGRMDVNLSERNRIFTQYSYENSPSLTPGLMPYTGHANPLGAQLAMVSWTSTLSPSQVNELRLAFAREQVWDMGPELPGIQTQLGITGTADPNGVPYIGLSGIGSFGTSLGRIGDISNSYQIHDSFSWLHGKHLIKHGEDLNYLRSIPLSTNAHARGQFIFSNMYTSQLSAGAPVANTGSSFADFLLGFPQTSFTISMPPTHVRWTNFEPYIQDSWRVRPGLTFNYGLAYYLTTPPNPVGPDRNLISGFDLNTGHFTYAALGQMSPQVYPTSYHNFAPRMGLAWQPMFLSKTVLRAGWGMYYSTPPQAALAYSVANPGVAIIQTVNNLEPSPTYVLGVNDMPPLSIRPITPEFQQAATGPAFIMSPDFQTPYVEQWTLDVQRIFGKQDLLDLAYLGTEGHHLPMTWQANDCVVLPSLKCDLAAMPYGTKFPYISQLGSVGNSNYQAILVKFQHQFSNSFSLLANYSYSKTMAMGTQGGIGFINGFGACRRCDSGPALYSVPQTFSLSAVWDLPFGRGGRWLDNTNRYVNAAVEGWGLNTIVTFQKGRPITIITLNTTPSPTRMVRADRLCDGRRELSNKDLRTNGLYWLDAACFAQPAPGYFGDGGMGVLAGPGLNNWDVALTKRIRVHEAIALEFRSEFFNAFNHAQFANPDTNVTDVNFGLVTATQHDNREIQLGLRLVF
jgi:hypothetical protein